jgi:Na+/melibiose symporter-like transporter
VSPDLPARPQYVLETPSLTFAYILTFFGGALAGVPLWLRFTPRIQKKSGLLGGMTVIGMAISLLWFAREGDIGLVFAIAATAGLASAGTDVLFPSIQADVIDWDELQTGERKEGAYFAAWAFSVKGAAALASVGVGVALGAMGFVPNQQQTPAARDGMRMLAALGPASLYAIGVVLFSRFRLGEREHAQILADLSKSGRRIEPR